VKITNIRATPVNIPLEAPFWWTGGLYPGASKVIVEVETNEGLVGLDERETRDGYEKLIMDADFCAAPHVWMGGLKLDENQLALDAFREVGPGKHFFGCAHTLANYETAFWDSAVADNDSFEQWRDEGMKDAPARAAERRRRLLTEYERPKLDLAINEELPGYVRRRKAERPDQWH
jgi:trimethylamine--corrinoid protein Co-methyltransferase